ncbi:MAG: MFS transporter [Bacteroidetes bacterium]|nr:MFS transporter [Bacteroidota bacterium]
MKSVNKLILVAALGYFVDIYDLLLFGVERVASLNDILSSQFPAISKEKLAELNALYGKQLLNWQMAGMLIGGIFWGVLGDKKGRLSVLFGSILTYSLANIINGFVNDTSWYAAMRFVSGFGLAGELGAGITLISESMSKEKRGIGTMIVATVGVFGAVVAGFMGNVFPSWRYSYFFGGAMGLALLVLRIGVFESGMYASIKEEHISKGNFFNLFKTASSLKKYLCIIFVTVPVWYAMGTLVIFSPELFAKLSGNPDNAKLVSGGQAIMYAYSGITVGDFACGFISQILKSRKKTLFLFLVLVVLSMLLYFTLGGRSVFMYYTSVVCVGFATGYWAVFISTASELFGTNLRATATTTAPNFVRASTIFISYLLSLMTMLFGSEGLAATIATGLILLTIAFFALYHLEETFGKDLNYTE